jgi:hypothetical protein
MIRFRWMFCALLLIVLFGSEAHAGTVTAASCNQSDVSKALSSATAGGTTVIIPAGTCTWSSTLSYTQVGNLIIQGSGNQSTLGGGDQTIIVDNVSKTGSPNQSLSIHTISNATFRITAITFQGGTPKTIQGFAGSLRIDGNSQSVRVDHMHFWNLNDVGVQLDGWEYGVVDHCVFDLGSTLGTVFGVRAEHDTWNNDNNGNGSWSDLPYFGTNKAIYVENNVFNCTYFESTGFGCYGGDDENGAHFVLRDNTFNDTYVLIHDMASDERAPRMFEIYQNTFNNTDPSKALASAIQVRTGTGMIWGNTVNKLPGIGSLWNDRSQNALSFGSTPSNWGYCGTQFGPSNWDGNTDSTGYPCLDQIGRGKGDELSGLFPNKVNRTTGNISWPHQAVEPLYEWLDSWNGPGYGSYWGNTTGNVVVMNRDYYIWCAPSSAPSNGGCSTFSGAVGTGSGLLSARPSSCSAGPGGNTPGVAYWATDTNTLYVCNPTNTWTAYYTPFTYPHPLTLGSDPAPAAPTNISIVVN